MASSVSACIGGFLALGGQVTTNSSACTTGTEAVVDAFHKVREGRAARVIAGGAEGSSHYIWAGFDAMRVLARQSNDRPGGRVPPDERLGRRLRPVVGRRAADGGEPVVGARPRGADLRGDPRRPRQLRRPARRRQHDGAEPRGREALRPGGAGRRGHRPATRVDAINGHLTATMADPLEIGMWQRALGRRPEDFPWINSTKSLDRARPRRGGRHRGGRVRAAAQPRVHPRLDQLRGPASGPRPVRGPHPARHDRRAAAVLAKASFGFGDVNGCLIFGRWEDGEQGETAWTRRQRSGRSLEHHQAVREERGGLQRGDRRTRIIEDLGVNSARLVDIILAFEDEFGIEVDDESADRVRTLGDAVQMILQKTAPAH